MIFCQRQLICCAVQRRQSAKILFTSCTKIIELFYLHTNETMTIEAIATVRVDRVYETGVQCHSGVAVIV